MFDGIGRNRTNIGKLSIMKVGDELRISLEYVEGMFESCMNKRKFMTVLDNSWNFLTKIRYNNHLPLLGHYFQNNCLS